MKVTTTFLSWSQAGVFKLKLAENKKLTIHRSIEQERHISTVVQDGVEILQILPLIMTAAEGHYTL